MLPIRNGVLAFAAAAALILAASGLAAIFRGPQRIPSGLELLLLLAGIALGVLLLAGLRRPTNSPATPEGLTEIHDWGGDRVEIVVMRDGNRGWVGRVRFGDQHLVWQERGATALQAYRKALEFFQQACPDHECGPSCGRLTTERP